ncbi:hypothetical protein O7599_29810 [Streptomyces sp. WMMC500]|uniref:hypothetical protein n=1 Tax=Streptomyces sp. WMMC500 TaxID=3015154 RepID=UPI00248ADDC1|nr:hypothetical protein [Streptomyces sp. WMMC500]WBB59710.1 hypothetical protein O7599_29810 [Streptomyces sp. WMMC500]
MPSVLGLLEVREKKVRAEVARLRQEAERITAALSAAEAHLERLGQARETVTEVMAEPGAGTMGQVQAAAVPGATLPHRAEGVSTEALAPECQRLLAVLAAPEAGGVRPQPRTPGMQMASQAPASFEELYGIPGPVGLPAAALLPRAQREWAGTASPIPEVLVRRAGVHTVPRPGH